MKEGLTNHQLAVISKFIDYILKNPEIIDFLPNPLLLKHKRFR
jgi:hypothetical protein